MRRLGRLWFLGGVAVLALLAVLLVQRHQRQDAKSTEIAAEIAAMQARAAMKTTQLGFVKGWLDAYYAGKDWAAPKISTSAMPGGVHLRAATGPDTELFAAKICPPLDAEIWKIKAGWGVEIWFEAASGYKSKCASALELFPELGGTGPGQTSAELKAAARKVPPSPLKKYGRDVGLRISGGEIWIGMTAQMARESWGKPDSINRTTSESTVREQWVYRQRDAYLYFENGVLTTWQN